MDYYYLVRAYKTVGNSKYYIDEGVYANLSFEMTTVNRISYANGKMKLSWQPMIPLRDGLLKTIDYFKSQL